MRSKVSESLDEKANSDRASPSRTDSANPRSEHETGALWDQVALRNDLGTGRPLDGGVRTRMAGSFGASLENIRVHTDDNAARIADSKDARALTVGNEIVFGRDEYRPGVFSGDLLLAHEIAHSLQQRGSGPGLGESFAESHADVAALHAMTRLEGGNAPLAAAALTQTGGLTLHRCQRSRTNVQRALDGELSWTPALAQEALDQYRGLSAADRQTAFDRYYPKGAFQLLLAALPPGAADGVYSDVVRDLLQKAQRHGVFESARASGLANESQMEQTQADLMQARNLAAAQAARPSVAPPPTEAEVVAQQQTQVAQTSIAPSSSGLTPAEVASWTARANAAVITLINYTTPRHPELHLVAADIHVDVVGIENRGAGVLAYGSTVGGRPVAVVGRTFVQYVEANPAYALGTIVHELRGHPQYGGYGQPGVEYGLSLYDRAAARMPGYTQPTGADRTSEQDAYAYQETEIYSLLRQSAYNVPLAPEHTAAFAANYPEPEAWITRRVGILKQQWEPRIAKALLRGMYVRFRLDPRINAAALHIFERAVQANYPGAEAATATDILR